MPVTQPILLDTAKFDAAGGAATLYAVLVQSAVADDSVRMPAAAGAQPAGVAMEALGTTLPTGASSTGAGIAVLKAGVATCIAQAGITAGAKVSIHGTTGKVKTAVSGDHVVGTAQNTVTTDGDQVRVWLAFGGTPLP